MQKKSSSKRPAIIVLVIVIVFIILLLGIKNIKAFDGLQRFLGAAAGQSSVNYKTTSLGSVIVDSNTNAKLFTQNENACGVENKEEMFVLLGETYDPSKDYLYHLSDVWSTFDGINWKQEKTTTAMGEKWEPMLVKKGDMVYIFGGKYIKDSSDFDNSIYRSTDMVNWTYVGELPKLSRYYDKSIVNYQGDFYLISSEQYGGVWKSTDGSKWVQVTKENLWDGEGKDSVENSKGGYDSNTLGAYVAGGKIWYITQNHKEKRIYSAEIISNGSSKDGVYWTDEGPFEVAGKDRSEFDVLFNTTPAPISYNGKIWVSTVERLSGKPIVIYTNENDGKTWKLASGRNTKFGTPRYYSTNIVFKNKIWNIGGLNSAYDIYTTTNGKKWKKVKQASTNFPGPADRYLAAGTTILTSASSRAPSLQITTNKNSVPFTDQDQTGVTLGEWKIEATSKSNNNFSGDIKLSGFSFLGTTIGVEESSLEYMQNIKIYVNDQLMGSLDDFTGPFYSASGELNQMFTLSNPLILHQGESKTIKLVADFSFDTNMTEFTTYLTGFEFVDSDSVPCSIYSSDNTNQSGKYAGNTIKQIGEKTNENTNKNDPTSPSINNTSVVSPSTPTPTATSIQTPAPTPITPVPTTPAPAQSSTPSNSTPTPTPASTPNPTPAPTQTQTPTPTQTQTPTPTPAPTTPPAPAQSSTSSTPTPTATPAPTQTPTPAPTPAPAPAPTPAPAPANKPSSTQKCVVNYFTANPKLIIPGTSATLSWSTTGCTNVEIYPSLNSVNSSGSQMVVIHSSTLYTLYASGINHTSATTVVNIGFVPPTPPGGNPPLPLPVN